MLPQVAILNWDRLSADEQTQALDRPVARSAAELRQKVSDILQEVRAEGDTALTRLTERFDGVRLDGLAVRPEEWAAATEQVDATTRQAMATAIDRIHRFHSQQEASTYTVETGDGITCRRESRPIEKVGLYAPGGTAPLPSTVIMLSVPAALAGCPVKILCTPPNRDGRVNPHILLAAKLSGIDQVFKVGGAQAIGAMAYGTATIPKVYKIFGPGNSWVTEAKLQVAQDPKGATYDMPAGPSEVLVIADKSAEPEFVAMDLLSQAEHGADSQSILVTPSSKLANQVQQAINRLAPQLSRQDILGESLRQCRLIVCQSLEACLQLANQYGPEHLIVQTQDPDRLCPGIQNAGSVFLGPWTPESVGDYASGTNHVLPTYGYARSISGLSVDSFRKHITFQQLTRQGITELGPVVEHLARLEGLDAHEQAVALRLAKARQRGVQ
jgi:histidinol dehydrogenase